MSRLDDVVPGAAVRLDDGVVVRLELGAWHDWRKLRPLTFEQFGRLKRMKMERFDAMCPTSRHRLDYERQLDRNYTEALARRARK